MAFRATLSASLRSMANRQTTAAANHRTMASSTAPKMESAFTQIAADAHPPKTKLRGTTKAEHVPIYMVMGMVVLAVSFAVHTAKQQLRYSPAVQVTKKKRETMAEVVDPDNVVNDASKFIRKSFFRKLAHIQESDHSSAVPDHIRGDIFANSTKAETLKSVGVDPRKY